ncbi:MAG: hypothetical protein ACLTBV_14395 [Enterocloster bolteae]
MEADSVTDELDGSQTSNGIPYPEVYEEQNIQVPHPGDIGTSRPLTNQWRPLVTIRITAPEGVLPADTQIQAEEITEQVESDA